VALGIPIQRKYGRQQVRWTTPTFHTPHVPYLSSITGGWWTRPSNWKANTAILFAGILGVSYGVWTVSADREVSSPGFFPTSVSVKLWTSQYRYNEPTRPIPSMLVRSRLAYSTSHDLTHCDSFLLSGQSNIEIETLEERRRTIDHRTSSPVFPRTSRRRCNSECICEVPRTKLRDAVFSMPIKDHRTDDKECPM